MRRRRAGGSWSRSSSGSASEVHLAEPAEAAALKGKKKRAKTDWADARHLRELLVDRPAARVVDPAGAHPRSPRPGPGPAILLSRSANGVAAADALGALSPRVSRNAATCYSLESRQWIAGLEDSRPPPVSSSTISLADHRRARHQARPRSIRELHADRPQAARLPGADRADLRESAA